MALGSSSDRRAATLRFVAETDRNALRRTLVGFGDLKKGIAQFERQAANQQGFTRAVKQNKALAASLSQSERATGRAARGVRNYGDAAKRAAGQVDRLERASKEFDAVSKRVALAGDVQSNLGAVRGLSSLAGAGGLAGGIGAGGELTVLIEELPRLKKSLAGMPETVRAATKELGGGLRVGLAGGIAVATAAIVFFRRQAEKAKQAQITILESQQTAALFARTASDDAIAARQAEIQTQLESARFRQADDEQRLRAQQAQISNRNRTAESILRFNDALGTQDIGLDSIKEKLAQEVAEVERLEAAHNVLTRTLERQRSGLVGRGATAEAIDSDEFVSAMRELLKRRSIELGQEILQFPDAEIRAMTFQGGAVDAALANIIRARAAEQVAIDAQSKSLELIRVQRQREDADRLQAQQKRDFNRANADRRAAEAAKEAAKNFNIAQKAAESFAKIQGEIQKITASAAQKAAAIFADGNRKRAELQDRFAEQVANAQRAGQLKRLSLQETFQENLFRLQRQFSRSQQTAVGQRDALAAHNAAIVAADAQSDAKRAQSNSLRDLARAEKERARVRQQALGRSLRLSVEGERRQLQVLASATAQQVNIRQQAMQAETAVMAQFAVQGVGLVQNFVRGALGALSALSAGGRAATTRTSTQQINRQVDSRIVTLIGGSAGLPPPISRSGPS